LLEDVGRTMLPRPWSDCPRIRRLGLVRGGAELGSPQRMPSVRRSLPRACWGPASGSAYPSPAMQAVGRPYPPAQRLDTVDELHGRLIPDPYRWLEDPASPQTIAWSEAQNRLCRGLLDALPGREHLRRRYRELFSVGYVSGPHWL